MQKKIQFVMIGLISSILISCSLNKEARVKSEIKEAFVAKYKSDLDQGYKLLGQSKMIDELKNKLIQMANPEVKEVQINENTCVAKISYKEPTKDRLQGLGLAVLLLHKKIDLEHNGSLDAFEKLVKKESSKFVSIEDELNFKEISKEVDCIEKDGKYSFQERKVASKK